MMWWVELGCTVLVVHRGAPSLRHGWAEVGSHPLSLSSCVYTLTRSLRHSTFRDEATL